MSAEPCLLRKRRDLPLGLIDLPDFGGKILGILQFLLLVTVKLCPSLRALVCFFPRTRLQNLTSHKAT